MFGWIAFVPPFIGSSQVLLRLYPPTDPNSKVFDMVVHRGTQMVPSEWSYGSYYCSKILQMVSTPTNDVVDL